MESSILNSRYVGSSRGRQHGSRWTGIFLSAVLALCLSCSENDGDIPAAEGSVELQLTLTLGDGVSTKSTYSEYSGETESSTDYENTLSSVQVFLYATVDGTADVYVGALTQVALYESSSGVYVYHGAVTPSGLTANSDGSYTFSGKIMILADCSSYSPTVGITTLSDNGLSSLTYTASTDAGGVISGGIPMWGIQSVSSVTLSPGICTVLSDSIDLLRAMAKIVLVLDDDDYDDDENYGNTATDYTITSATLSTYNSSGYCLPTNYSSVTATKSLDTETCTNVCSDSQGSNLSFSVEEGYTQAYVYVPEFAASTEATMSVTIKKTSTEKSNTETLYLQTYQDGSKSGTGQELIRNHVYTYTLSKAYDSDLYVTCTVDAWTDETSSVAWDESDLNVTLLPNNASGFSDTESGDEEARYCILTYPRWNIKSSSSSSMYYGVSGKYFEPSKSYASYEFNLTSSGGQVTWKAYLSNPDYFSFNTGTSDIDSGNYNASTGVSRSNSYCIKIGPYGPNNALWDDSYQYNDLTGYKNSSSNGEVNIYKDGVKYVDNCKEGCAQFLIYADDEYRSEGASEYYVYYDGSNYSTYTGDSSSGYNRYSYTVGSTDASRDTVVAVYTDFFILIDGAPVPTPLTINPAISDLTVTYDGHFKERVYPGGTYEKTVQVDIDGDGEADSVTLGAGQWIRIFWACAMPGLDEDGEQEYTSKDVWEKLMSVDSDTGDYIYMPESDHWFDE